MVTKTEWTMEKYLKQVAGMKPGDVCELHHQKGTLHIEALECLDVDFPHGSVVLNVMGGGTKWGMVLVGKQTEREHETKLLFDKIWNILDLPDKALKITYYR